MLNQNVHFTCFVWIYRNRIVLRLPNSRLHRRHSRGWQSMCGCHFGHSAVLPRLMYKIEPFWSMQMWCDSFSKRQYHRPNADAQITFCNFVTIEFISLRVDRLKHQTDNCTDNTGYFFLVSTAWVRQNKSYTYNFCSGSFNWNWTKGTKTNGIYSDTFKIEVFDDSTSKWKLSTNHCNFIINNAFCHDSFIKEWSRNSHLRSWPLQNRSYLKCRILTFCCRCNFLFWPFLFYLKASVIRPNPDFHKNIWLLRIIVVMWFIDGALAHKL